MKNTGEGVLTTDVGWSDRIGALDTFLGIFWRFSRSLICGKVETKVPVLYAKYQNLGGVGMQLNEEWAEINGNKGSRICVKPKNGSSADVESFKGMTVLHYPQAPLEPVRGSRASGREACRGTGKSRLWCAVSGYWVLSHLDFCHCHEAHSDHSHTSFVCLKEIS